MEDSDKTKPQLLKKLALLRQQVSQLATLEAERKRMEESLSRVGVQMAIVLGDMSELVVYQDTENRILWTNRAAGESVGLAPEQLVGRYCYEVWHQRHEPCTGCPVVKARETSQPQEAEITTPDGRVWLIRGSPSKDVNGNVTGVIEVTQEITERKKLEKALHDSEQHFRALIENALDVVTIINADATISYQSPPVEHVLGYKPEELIGRSMFDFIHPDDSPMVMGELAHGLQDPDYSRLLEFRVRHKDGSWRHVEAVGKNLLEDPAVKGLIANYRDITARKQTEEALIQSEEQYRAVLEQTQDAYFELDLTGTCTFINDPALRTLGYSREEMIGTNYRAYVFGEDGKVMYQAFNLVYRTGQPIKNQAFRLVRKDGSIAFSEFSVLPLRNEKGEIIGFRGIGRDITERKQAEEEKRRLEQKAYLVSHLASVGEMASGIAHEINNPLTGVIGYAQLLSAREDVPEDIREDLKVINEGAQRVAGIVRRLLTFARQYEPQRTHVNINEIIKTTLELRAYHLETSNIKVTTQLDPDLPVTVADSSQLQQVLLNLIVNAETEMKLAHGRGKLLIKTEQVHNTIRMSVQDTGPGIAPENLDRVFDPFFTTRKVGEGTGLGLSICHGIIAEHNGKIYAQSQLGKGATFIVELPIVTESEEMEQAAPTAKKPKKVIKAKMLVVDDEPVVRDFLSRVLTDEGHQVETTDNADDALERIKSRRYRLILLDVKMPGMSGSELYERIHQIAKSLARRVVFITCDVIGADTQDFLSRTNVPYITKPFDTRQLKKEIKRILS